MNQPAVAVAPVNPNKDAHLAMMKDVMQKCDNLFTNLLSRWLDEKEYEDFNEYSKRIERHISEVAPAGTKFIKASKRPFGCIIQLPGMTYKVQIYRTCTALGCKGVK